MLFLFWLPYIVFAGMLQVAAERQHTDSREPEF